MGVRADNGRRPGIDKAHDQGFLRSRGLRVVLLADMQEAGDEVGTPPCALCGHVRDQTLLAPVRQDVHAIGVVGGEGVAVQAVGVVEQGQADAVALHVPRPSGCDRLGMQAREHHLGVFVRPERTRLADGLRSLVVGVVRGAEHHVKARTRQRVPHGLRRGEARIAAAARGVGDEDRLLANDRDVVFPDTVAHLLVAG